MRRWICGEVVRMFTHGLSDVVWWRARPSQQRRHHDRGGDGRVFAVARPAEVVDEGEHVIGGGSLPDLRMESLHGIMRIQALPDDSVTLRFDEYRGNFVKGPRSSRRAALDWARRLGESNRFDSEIERSVRVSEVVDGIYGR